MSSPRMDSGISSRSTVFWAGMMTSWMPARWAASKARDYQGIAGDSVKVWRKQGVALGLPGVKPARGVFDRACRTRAATPTRRDS